MQTLKIKTTVLLSLVVFVATGFWHGNAANAAAVTIIEDTWINWPGYTSANGDEIGNPKLDRMRVTINDNNILERVELLWRPNSGEFTRIKFDSLFINSYDITTTNSDWDDWDYFVHDGGDQHSNTGGHIHDVVNGHVPWDGLWEVKANYKYTTAKSSDTRQDNPNGIDRTSLKHREHFSSYLTWDSQNGILTYDLAAFGISAENGVFVAYAPYCANDLIGGYASANPVPIPATVWLFASGLLGLVTMRRRTGKSV